MDSSDPSLPDLLSLAQLRQTASSTQAQPYRVRAQVEALVQRQTAQGKPYFDVKLTDGTETLTWRVFDNNPLFLEIGNLSRQAWVELTAEWIDTGKYGLEPKNPHLRRLTEDEVQSSLLGSDDARMRLAEDYECICSLVHEMADPRFRALGKAFLEKHGERFKRTAAARDFHHARRGGLVEHVAQMMRSARALCAVYTQLNKDLLVAGVLFHDCGKLWETVCPENGFNIPLQLHGEMLGHISIGMELVNKLWRDCLESEGASEWLHLEPTNENVRLHLLHLIASHHGEMEFGSPVLPKTPEAMALHYIDNLDAKMEMFRRGYETSEELAPGIFVGVRPLKQKMISPLAVHQPLTSEDS
ncbi:MAG: HD domain-containing protein [Verrucomicrobiaceae bacterium]|nr:HD domain-containing protein [Verrucomicrobiaceae bacterium]